MARARFPGKPLRLHHRRRVRLLDPDADADADEPTQGLDADKKSEDENGTNNICENDTIVPNNDSNDEQINVKTRSQQKMQVVKNETEKNVSVPVKKTVTFGSVESCSDSFKTIKKVPLKTHRPLVSIIKKKSALKTDPSFHSIVKPAKLTDLGSKTCLDFSSLRAHNNRSPPVKLPTVRFSTTEDDQNSSLLAPITACLNPLTASSDKESNNRRFVLPSHSAHSSRVIKPNKRFIENDEPSAATHSNSPSTAKVLKKPKLILNNQNDSNNLCYDEAYETCDSSANSNDSSDSKNLSVSCQNPIKPPSYFDKNLNLFGAASAKTLSTSFQETYTNNSKSVVNQDSETFHSEKSEDKHDKNESVKESISRCLKLQPSRSISETPCTSDQSSSTTASESSDSEESLWCSDSEGSDQNEKINNEKTPVSSQLTSGKVVLREARLQLTSNNGISNSNGSDGPFSSFGSNVNSNVNPPGTVTCGVCGAVRFYRFVRQARKFGIYSCESCRKFISKMLKRQNISQNSPLPPLECLSGDGSCRVPPIVRSQQWKLLRCAYKARCHACWLKMCIKAFQVPSPLKASLQLMLPSYMQVSAMKNLNIVQSPAVETNDNIPVIKSPKRNKSNASKKLSDDVEVGYSSKTSNTKVIESEIMPDNNRKRHHTRLKVRKKDKTNFNQHLDSTKRQKVELKGPRVKHVCRSASIVLGQPIATFPYSDEKSFSDISDDNSTLDHSLPLSELTEDTDAPKLNAFSETEDKVTSDNSEIDKRVEISKDEESSDSFVSIVLNDDNKENSSLLHQQQIHSTDNEKDDDGKYCVEPLAENALQRKQTKHLLSNLSNVKCSLKQKYNQQRPETICIDYWESYDPDEVCNTGWGLISPVPFTLNGACFLCGSRGKEKLIHCVACCEMYHLYCAEVNEESGRVWLCPRCVQCSGCGKIGVNPAATICRVCRRHFHANCLVSNGNKYRSDWPQICGSCLKCKSCDSFKVSKFLGNLPFCIKCFRLRQKGNYCPLCQGCYQDNDFDSKMMECGWCSRWVHARCEGLTGEGYQLVSALPHSVEYICKQCMPENAPWRNMISSYLRGKLLGVLKALAKNKNACALLKLTPHKNTPISNRNCSCIPPSTIRKLKFDDDSCDIPFKDNLERSTMDTINNNKKDLESDFCENDCEMSTSLKDNRNGKVKGTVHKLPEALLQNKEICLSIGPRLTEKKSKFPNDEYAYSDSESDVYCEKSYVHNELNCDEKHNKDEVSKFINKECDVDTEVNKCCCIKDQDISPSLLDIKTRVNCNEYVSVKDFNKDMLAVITMLSPEVKQVYKEVFTDIFPWFDCELNCLNPSLEIEDDNDEDSLKDEDLSIYSFNKNNEKVLHKMNVDYEQSVPSLENDYKTFNDFTYDDESLYDTRMCVLCKVVGEGNPSMEERLLYCGQGDWIHANCALWSAEVFEEIDGSLQNVQSAIARGKMIKCSKCSNKGASVGCCAKNCSETYHFTCARTIGCVLLDDKRVFCPSHVNDANDKALQKDNDFILSRPVYVELDKRKKKYSDPQKVQFLLGSLVIKNLGRILPSVSDFEDVLIPVDFLCGRLYWSSKEPWKITKYTIKTKLLVVEPSPAYDLGVNITLDHSMNPNTVERILAEIDSWHKSLEIDGHNFALKKDKSPIKFGSANVSLEDYAVKQVVEYMLDLVCKQDQNDETPEEEPQNTADLLPPELKDAIFEDLNHDLLDGISMQDIFPKLCYEDLVAMDLKNEIGFGNEVLKENRLIENIEENVLKPSDEVLLPLQEKLKKSVYLSHLNSELTVEGKTVSQDYFEDMINQNEPGRELKRSKSELVIHGANIKNITPNKHHQRSCSLTWNYKIDSTLTSSIKRCKLPRTNFLTRSDGTGNVVMVVDGTSDLVSNIGPSKFKIDDMSSDMKLHWHSKSVKTVDNRKEDLINRSTSPSLLFKNVDNETDDGNELCTIKVDKSDTSNEQVIDFYTKMRCSPISQLDGADDFLPNSCKLSVKHKKIYADFTLIPQLDGADDVSSSSSSESGSPPREQNSGLFFRPNNIDNTCTLTISANLNNIINSNEMLIRPQLEENIIRIGQSDQMVKCDRCHCTYRTKDSYNRHLPTCDMMSTSESEGETPKSPESRTLTTLQNAFNGQFIAPTYINQTNQTYDNSDHLNINKPALVSARRTSVNTRQITINGTIVETPSPGPQSPLRLCSNDTLNSQDVAVSIKSSIIHDPTKINLGQNILSQPQIVVATNLPVTPPRNQTPSGSKCIIGQNQSNIPYSICVKPNTGIHTIQPSNQSIAHVIPSSGGIQTVFSSNPNQVLTIANPQQNIIQNIQTKTPIMQAFGNISNGQTLAVPMGSLQSLPNAANNNINAFVRPSMPLSNSPAILMSPTNTSRITSPNVQQKNQLLLPQMGQKSPKKIQVQPKPILQAVKGRGRTPNKALTNKKPNKPEKIISNINPTLGPNGTVIQFQPNNTSGQPSIILQPVPNPNVMSAYVEAIQQQGPNMQYIATITPQGEFKSTPTHYIAQSGILPQTFQIQQTESGGLVAVPSGGIPVFLPQGGVGILPQASLQSSGMAISSQGNIQSQGVTPILPQGGLQTQNNATILPQATIQTQNGTIIPQNTIQSIPQNNIQNPASLLPTNNISSQGATIVQNSPQNILPQSNLSSQNNAIISQQPNTAILPQGTILPQGLQFCNDQVLLTDSSGCMYLTTQPVYYGLETIVQNTVMSSQQFVSTAMQGVLAQNSSFSATTTQVFQASKIEPIVEMPTGYVVVNNVPQENIVASQPSAVNSQALISTQNLPNNNISTQSNSLQIQKNVKNIINPAVSIQPGDKLSSISNHKTGNKISHIQPNQPIFSISSSNQAGNTVSLQNLHRSNISLAHEKQNTNIQPMQTTIMQLPNNSLSMNSTSQTGSSSSKVDNVHLHINHPIMTSSINNNLATKIPCSIAQFSQLNAQDTSINNNQELPTLHLHPLSTQQPLKVNLPQQNWKSNLTSIATENGKNQILNSDEMHEVISPKNITILSNNINNIITSDTVGNSKNYTSINNNFNESLSKISGVNVSATNSINNNPTVMQSSPCSYGNNHLNHNNVSLPVSSFSSVSPYIISGTLNQQVSGLGNNCINIVSSKECQQNIKNSDDISQTSNQSIFLNENMITRKPTTIHQIPCNIHNNVAIPITDNLNCGNNNSTPQLTSNMMNLSLQGGKIYQIPMSGNNFSHLSVNDSAASNNIQNTVSCNFHLNHITNQSNNSNNSQIVGTLGPFSSTSKMDHLNCINNNQSNIPCTQHQIDRSDTQNQIITVSGVRNQSQNQTIDQISTIHNHHSSNNNAIVGCAGLNHIQIINNSSNQMQIASSNMNMNANTCNNVSRQISGDHISIINNDMNKQNDSQTANERDAQITNISCINRNLNSGIATNSNVISSNQVRENQSQCSVNIPNMSQFHVNSDQMFIINNGANRFQNMTNEAIDSGNNQISHINMSSQVQDVCNQMNLKAVNKPESFNAKHLPLIQTDNNSIKVSSNKQMANPIISMPSGNQVGYIQMNGTNNQIISYTDNILPISNNGPGHFQTHRNQNTPMLTISLNDMSTSTGSSKDNSCISQQTKNNDMPSLSMPLHINATSNITPSSAISKQINLPQHSIGNNCVNSSNTFPVSIANIQGYTNSQMCNNGVSSVNLPSQNSNTITLPIQSTSITLPKAPSHPSGIPTNVVNPIPQYMRPMNRVLPIHRDAQSTKQANKPVKTKVEAPKPSPRCQDMPDLNAKEDDPVNNEIEKSIRDSKSSIEQNKNSNISEDINLTDISDPVTVSSEINKQHNNTKKDISDIQAKTKLKIETSNAKIFPKTLKENLSNNLIKQSLQKFDPKICKENSVVFNNLKSQNLSNQKKTQIRTKMGSDNISNMKATKNHPSVGRTVKDEGPKMIYEVSSDDGFTYTSTSLSELWNKIIEAVQNARKQHNLPLVKFSPTQSMSNAHILGLHNNSLKYLIEQLPGANRCTKYRAKHTTNVQTSWDSDVSVFESFRESPWGSARVGPVIRKPTSDIFNWLSSPYRDPPPPLIISQDDTISTRRLTSTTLPMAMRFRHLKETSKHAVGVYRSRIHGRGLFCRRDIEAGEMVIEYAGEVIRAALADQRERRYEAGRGGRGVTGCYMFRVDDHLVVDATMKGNAARFINHSCDPNCYSKVVDILGHKHILILALRRIYQGEELTYDYKFPFEEVKIPCSCGAKKCRKYLN